MTDRNPDASMECTDASAELDPAAVRRRIRRRGQAVAVRERLRALDRLEDRGELTPERQQVLGDLATDIVEGILAAPEAAIETGLESEREALEAALDLFDTER